MLDFLFGLGAVRLMERVANRSVRRLKRTGFGILFLQVSGPFWLVGSLLWLTAFFLLVSHLSRFTWPVFWTGLVSFGWALVLLLIAILIMARSNR